MVKIKQRLKWCVSGLLFAAGSVSVLGNVFWYKVYIEEKRQKEKNLCLKQMFIKWLENTKSKIKISDYLGEMGIKTVAIYGMSDAGWKLYDELKNSDIIVEYAIDKRVIDTDTDIEMATMEGDLKKVDVIIVTAIYDYDEILKELKKKTDCRIISLEQVIYEAEGYFSC